MKVLVTGAAGFVGSRLAEVLLDGGHAVCGFDLLDGEDPPGWQQARLEQARGHERYTFVRGDVTDAASMDEVVVDFRPDALVHLASRRDLGWAEEMPEACLRLHAEGTACVLQACLRKNIPQAVIGSSSHVYGGTRRFPFTEDDPADRPLSVIGAALRAAELAAYAHALRSPVNVTVLRVFSVYGPRQSPVRLVPALAAAAERRVPMPVFGDGTAGRDMIFVDDAVVGFLRALDRPAPWRVLNLGTGQTTTLDQVAELVAWLSDVELQRERLPLRPGEMPHTFARIDAARDGIGFTPAVGLEEGIRRTLDWHRERGRAFCDIRGGGSRRST